MPRYSQCKFSRVWHPNIPKFCPTLWLDWCRKQGWQQENRLTHLTLFSFPIQEKFITTYHFSNSPWMSKPGISTKWLVQKLNEKKILRDGTWTICKCISKGFVVCRKNTSLLDSCTERMFKQQNIGIMWKDNNYCIKLLVHSETFLKNPLWNRLVKWWSIIATSDQKFSKLINAPFVLIAYIMRGELAKLSMAKKNLSAVWHRVGSHIQSC